MWSTDNKRPLEECVEDTHTFKSKGQADHIICQCGQTIWVFAECPHCHMKRGKAVPIEEANKYARYDE